MKYTNKTKNEQNIARMVTEFRNWQRKWDRYTEGNEKQPMDVDEFIRHLSQKFTVEKMY